MALALDNVSEMTCLTPFKSDYLETTNHFCASMETYVASCSEGTRRFCRSFAVS